MSDKAIVALVWSGAVIFLLALFPPGRALLSFTLSQAWKFTTWSGHLLFAWAQGIAVRVWKAHVTVARNLGPRQWVLPSVARKGTRRE